jgi:hypothetical protein
MTLGEINFGLLSLSESKIYLGRLVQNKFWTPEPFGVQDLSWAPRPK